MKKMILSSFLSILFFFSVSSSGITGTVKCNNLPQQNAVVGIDANNIITYLTTNSSGIYKMNLLPGIYYTALEQDGSCVIPISLWTQFKVNYHKYTTINYSF